MLRATRLLHALALALVLTVVDAGLAAAGEPAPAPDSTQLTPVHLRAGSVVNRRDMNLLLALDRRLDTLGDRDPWRMGRARALLNVAAAEYANNDQNGFDLAAFAEVQRLADVMAAGAPPLGADSALALQPLAGSRRVREEQWRRIAELAFSPGAACAIAELTRAQAELEWAGNESIDQCDCRVNVHNDEVGRLLASASALADSCASAARPGR